MKIIYSVLAMLLIVVACIVAIFLVDQPAASTGTAHASIAGMQVGGNGPARFEPVAIIVLIMFSAILIMMGTLLYMGISKHRRTHRARIWIATGTVALLFVWWSMFGSYSAYLASGDFQMFLGFPLPTAFTVYGLWLAGFIFVIAYVLGFRTFVLTEDDEVAYRELIAKHKHDTNTN